jgi:hypothetical protein
VDQVAPGGTLVPGGTRWHPVAHRHPHKPSATRSSGSTSEAAPFRNSVFRIRSHPGGEHLRSGTKPSEPRSSGVPRREPRDQVAPGGTLVPGGTRWHPVAYRHPVAHWYPVAPSGTSTPAQVFRNSVFRIRFHPGGEHLRSGTKPSETRSSRVPRREPQKWHQAFRNSVLKGSTERTSEVAPSLPKLGLQGFHGENLGTRWHQAFRNSVFKGFTGHTR